MCISRCCLVVLLDKWHNISMQTTRDTKRSCMNRQYYSKREDNLAIHHYTLVSFHAREILSDTRESIATREDQNLTDDKHRDDDIDRCRSIESKDQISNGIDQTIGQIREILVVQCFFQYRRDIRWMTAQFFQWLLKFTSKQQTWNNDQSDKHSIGDRMADKFDARLFEEALQLRRRAKIHESWWKIILTLIVYFDQDVRM